MTEPREFELIGDLTSLPVSETGARHLVWWGNTGFMVIEGTGFLLAAAAYLYLMTQAPAWPPKGDPLPGLTWSGVLTVLLLLSEIPNLWVLRCARHKDAAGVRWGVFAMAVIGALILIPRGLEFAQIGPPWYADAYGSILWTLLILHTTHIVTDLGDTIVISAWLFMHEVDPDRFADVEDNSNYWTFVVLVWVPIYVLIYWAPRLV